MDCTSEFSLPVIAELTDSEVIRICLERGNNRDNGPIDKPSISSKKGYRYRFKFQLNMFFISVLIY